MIIMFLDAMASLEFMLESERVGDVFGILSNLGHIFRVFSFLWKTLPKAQQTQVSSGFTKEIA